MTQKTLLCLGYGYVAARLAAEKKAEGWRVAGTTRSAEKAAAMEADGIEAIAWSGGALAEKTFDAASAILISTPPGETGCPAFAAAEPHASIIAKTAKWIGYLSTNGVYGDHDGAWVDEESNLHPTSDRSFRRIRAEADWAGLGAAWSLPVVIFRLPGIYGPGRSALDTVRAGRAQRIVKEGQVFSRAHVDDIVAALQASLAKPRFHDLYNIADDEPAPPQDVIEFACELLSVAPPPLTPIEEADLSDMARSFYADNKRVSNTRMKSLIGGALKHPTYREGLKAIFGAEKENIA